MPALEYVPTYFQGRELLIAVRKRLVSDDMIFFLHGFGCAKECFSGAFDQECLSDFSICTFDFPGHGKSSIGDKAAYSMQAYAEITNQLMNTLDHRRAYLACHSMGGAVGLIASQGRQDVQCYASIDGNLVAEDCGLISRDTAGQPPTDYLVSGYGKFLSQLKRSKSPDYIAWANWCAQADPTALHESATSLVEWSDSGKLLALFTSLPCKGYFQGDADDKSYLVHLLADTPTFTIPNAGHFMMVDNPDALYRALADFFVEARNALAATKVRSSL